MLEEEGRATGIRTLQLPESAVYALQQLGQQLTCFDRALGRREVDIQRALEVCMVLTDHDADRAAHLCQNLVDAVDDWNTLELAAEQDFVGQPIP